jgi:hypothetical protein
MDETMGRTKETRCYSHPNHSNMSGSSSRRRVVPTEEPHCSGGIVLVVTQCVPCRLQIFSLNGGLNFD